MKPTSCFKVFAQALWLCAFVTPLFAQPEYINYQGRLNDAAGQPLATGTYTVEFRIYNHPTASDSTNLVWGPFILDGATAQGHGSVATIVSGRFNVILGPQDVSARSIRDAFSGENRFLELRVNNGAPILPRQQFLTTPYAFKAHGVINDLAVPGSLFVAGAAQVQGDLSVQGQITSSTGNTTFHMVPRGGIILWSGSVTNVPAGWALCDGQNGTPDLRDRFVLGHSNAAPDGLIGETGGTNSHTHVVDIAPFPSVAGGGSVTINDGSFNDINAATPGHTHSINPPATTSLATEHIPPYIRLGFIMKL
ncbi:MAG TPA: hypothetical protein VF773_07835 [Verrucomicrobiae bacterium]